MNDKISNEQLIAYLYEELPPHEMAIVEIALAADDQLRADFEELRTTSHLLREWPAESPHMQLAFLSDSSASPSPLRRGFGQLIRHRAAPLAAAATFALLFFAGGFYAAMMVVRPAESDRDPAIAMAPQTATAEQDSSYVFFFNPDERKIYRQFTTRQQHEHAEKQHALSRRIRQGARRFGSRYHVLAEGDAGTHGIYVDGLGAVVYVGSAAPGEFEEREVLHIVDQMANAAPRVNHGAPRGSGANRQPPGEVLRLKKDLAAFFREERIAFETLPAGESIVFALETTNGHNIQVGSSNRFFLSVKKADLDTYQRGRMDFNEFYNRIAVREY